MSKLYDVANLVAADVSGTDGDVLKASPTPLPGILTTIIQIISSLIAGFAQCNLPPAVAANRMNNPGPILKISLRRTIKAHTQDMNTIALRAPIEESVLKVARTLKAPDVAELYGDVSN